MLDHFFKSSLKQLTCVRLSKIVSQKAHSTLKRAEKRACFPLAYFLDGLRWLEFPERFHERTVRRIGRHLINIEFESLWNEICVLVTLIRENTSIHITKAGLIQLFGHLRGWAQAMIARHLYQAQSDDHVLRGCSRHVESEREKIVLRFCFRRQTEERAASIEDTINFMRDSRIYINRFEVSRFVKSSVHTLALRQAIFLEQNCNNVTVDELRCDFDYILDHVRTTPSPFFWKAEKARIGVLEKQQPLRVIVSARTGPELTPGPVSRDYSQRTLSSLISSFRDSFLP
jgi:hypothetical protein